MEMTVFNYIKENINSDITFINNIYPKTPDKLVVVYIEPFITNIIFIKKESINSYIRKKKLERLINNISDGYNERIIIWLYKRNSKFRYQKM
jgi:hypothetical protein